MRREGEGGASAREGAVTDSESISTFSEDSLTDRARKADRQGMNMHRQGKDIYRR
jgi:hypothetical protein